MSKAWKIIKCVLIISSICLLAFVILFLAAFYYEEELKIKPVDTQTSPNGEYTLYLQQVGTPSWPFGPVGGKIVLKKDGKTIDKYKTLVYSDGANLSEYSWDVEWFDDKVVITIRGENGGEVITFDLT